MPEPTLRSPTADCPHGDILDRSGDALLAFRGAAVSEMQVANQRRTGRTFRLEDGVFGWSLRPGEMLVLCPSAHPAPAITSLMVRHDGSWTDLTHSVAILGLRDAEAPRILSKLCPLDLSRMPQNFALRTSMAQVATQIVRSAAGEIWLLAPRSYAPYLLRVLVDSASRPASLHAVPS
jgi:heterotetrameric sarcosine oxidase gamma subunit